MRTWKRFIFIFFAYGFALVHTVVPHQHYTAVNEKVNVSPKNIDTTSIGGFLQMVFSTDLGCGHLEKFKSTDDADIHFSVVKTQLLPTFVTPLISDLNILPSFPDVFGRYVERLQEQRRLFSSRLLRAPPVSLDPSISPGC
jgi:hypothetical protein